ncbi:MAG: hypothetical protein EBT83_04400, partial [Betaproteobacteria bacterium]|nr:hypothetical protein [Betaproteobacteria bacterium]
LASREIMESRPEGARPHLAQALSHHRLCVRANVLLGDLEVAQQKPEAAIEAWKRIESQNPAYLALVAERLLKAYRQMDKAGEGLNLLRGLLARYPSIDVLNVVFSCVLESEGTEPAYSRRSRAGQNTGAPAYPHAGDVQMRQLRLSRPSVLLALSRLWRMGNLFAAAH